MSFRRLAPLAAAALFSGCAACDRATNSDTSGIVVGEGMADDAAQVSAPLGRRQAPSPACSTAGRGHPAARVGGARHG